MKTQREEKKRPIVLKYLAFWIAILGVPLGMVVYAATFGNQPAVGATLTVSFLCALFYEQYHTAALSKTQKRFVAVKLAAIWILVLGWYIVMRLNMDHLECGILLVSVCTASVVLCIIYLVNLFKKTDGRAAAVVTCLTIAALWLYSTIMFLLSSWRAGTL